MRERKWHPPYKQLWKHNFPDYLLKQRWFGGKARKIASVDVIDTLPIPVGGGNAFIFIASVHYADGADEFYAIPLVACRKAPARMD